MAPVTLTDADIAQFDNRTPSKVLTDADVNQHDSSILSDADIAKFDSVPKPTDNAPKEEWDAYYKATVNPNPNSINNQFFPNLKESAGRLATGLGSLFSGDETKGLESQFTPEQIAQAKADQEAQKQAQIKENTAPIEPAKPGSPASYAGAIGSMIPQVGLSMAVPVAGALGAGVQGSLIGAADTLGSGKNDPIDVIKNAALMMAFHGAGALGSKASTEGAAAVNQAIGKEVVGEELAKRAGSSVGAATVGGVTGGQEGAVLGAGFGFANPSEPAKLDKFKPLSAHTDVELEAKLNDAIDVGINKGIKPTVVGKKTLGQRQAFDDRAKEAVKDIVLNKGTFEYTDKDGNVKNNAVPEDLGDFASATQQGLTKTFAEYDAQTKAAGETGVKVSTKNIENILKPIAESDIVAEENPRLHDFANRQLRALALRNHEYTPLECQQKIAEFNDALKATYTSGDWGVGNQRITMKKMVESLRSDLDTTIENSTGSSNYQALKNRYGAYKSLNKEVLHRLTVSGRANPRNLFDLADAFSAGEMAYGGVSLVTGNPHGLFHMARGAAVHVAKNAMKIQNDPNVIVKGMFGNVDKVMTEQAARAPKAEVLASEEKVQRDIPTVGANGLPNPSAQKALPNLGAEGRYNSVRDPDAIAPAASGEGQPVIRQGEQPSVEELGAESVPVDNAVELGSSYAKVEKVPDYQQWLADNKIGDSKASKIKFIEEHWPNSSKAKVAGAVGAVAVGALATGNADAAEIKDEDLKQAILGEAEGSGLDGMKSVASTIKNMGSLKGVYGKNAVVVKDGKYYRKTDKGLRLIPNSAVKNAEQAIADSKKKDYSQGSNHWFSDADLKTPKVQNLIRKGKMKFIKRVGGNNFYKEGK